MTKGNANHAKNPRAAPYRHGGGGGGLCCSPDEDGADVSGTIALPELGEPLISLSRGVNVAYAFSILSGAVTTSV